MTTLGPVEQTEHGFEIIRFSDLNDQACSLQQYAVSVYQPPETTVVVLGADNEKPVFFNQRTAKSLVGHLQNWLVTGSFEGKGEAMNDALKSKIQRWGEAVDDLKRENKRLREALQKIDRWSDPGRSAGYLDRTAMIEVAREALKEPA